MSGWNPAWADDETERLLRQRAVEDEDSSVRAKALELLAGREDWAGHPETVALFHRIRGAIRHAAKLEDRGAAACVYFRAMRASDPLADAKERVFSKDADGIGPFLDPLEPVSDEHLAQVARGAHLTDEQREDMVKQINAELGWDIRVGLRRKGR